MLRVVVISELRLVLMLMFVSMVFCIEVIFLMNVKVRVVSVVKKLNCLVEIDWKLYVYNMLVKLVSVDDIVNVVSLVVRMFILDVVVVFLLFWIVSIWCFS